MTTTNYFCVCFLKPESYHLKLLWICVTSFSSKMKQLNEHPPRPAIPSSLPGVEWADLSNWSRILSGRWRAVLSRMAYSQSEFQKKKKKSTITRFRRCKNTGYSCWCPGRALVTAVIFHQVRIYSRFAATAMDRSRSPDRGGKEKRLEKRKKRTRSSSSSSSSSSSPSSSRGRSRSKSSKKASHKTPGWFGWNHSKDYRVQVGFTLSWIRHVYLVGTRT